MEMKKYVVLPVVALLFASCALSASVTTNQWIGVTGGQWGSDTNWSLGHIPRSGELAYFNFSGQSMEVAISGDFEAGSMYVETAAKSAPLTFSGSGSVTLLANGGKSPYIMQNHPFTLDGVTLNLASLESLWYSPVTVRNGAVLTNTTGKVHLWTAASSLSVDGAKVSLGGPFYYAAQTSIDLKDGRISCSTFGVSSDSKRGTGKIALAISGGTMDVRGGFELNLESALTMTGGDLSIGGAVALSDASALSLTAGRLSLSKVIDASNKRLLLEARGTEIVTTGVSADKNWSIDLFTEPNERVEIRTPVTAFEGGFRVTQPNVTLWFDLERVLKVGNFFNDAGSSESRIYLPRTVVLSGKFQPFRTAGATDSGRKFFIYGPATFRTVADMVKNINKSSYPLFSGDFTVDTRDWNDGETPRAMAFRGFGAFDYASLKVTGGGSLWMMQAYSQRPFSSVTVDAGTEMIAAPLENGNPDFGPLSADRIVLGANARLGVEAGSCFVKAADWDVDSTAAINVTIPSGLTGFANKIVTDISGRLPSAVTVNIDGDGAADWAPVLADGQLSITKTGAETSGNYPYEWTGGGTSDKWSDNENWYGKAAPVSAQNNQIYYGAVSTRLSSIPDTSITISNIGFLDTATRSFHVASGNKTVTFGLRSQSDILKASVYSFSALPQYVEMPVRSGSDASFMAVDGPIILAGYNYQFEKAPLAATFAVVGDIRVSGADIRWPQLKMLLVERSYRDSRKAVGSHLTVLDGATVSFTNQVNAISPLDAENVSVRVNAGGTLNFDGGADGKYVWDARPAKITVDGMLNVNVPYVGGVNQNYGGRGEFNLSEILPGAASSVTTVEDSLTLRPKSDWTTIAQDSDASLTLRVMAKPTIRLGADWTYGPAAGVASAGSLSRAVEIVRDSVLHVDANGHTATFADPVAGEGVLAVTNGTVKGMIVSPVVLRLSAGGVFETDGQVIGGIQADGGTVRLTGENPLVVSGDVELAALRFEGVASARWKSCIVTDGQFVGEPVLPSGVKFRIVENDGRQILQTRIISGMCITVR